MLRTIFSATSFIAPSLKTPLHHLPDEGNPRGDAIDNRSIAFTSIQSLPCHSGEITTNGRLLSGTNSVPRPLGHGVVVSCIAEENKLRVEIHPLPYEFQYMPTDFSNALLIGQLLISVYRYQQPSGVLSRQYLDRRYMSDAGPNNHPMWCHSTSKFIHREKCKEKVYPSACRVMIANMSSLPSKYLHDYLLRRKNQKHGPVDSTRSHFVYC